MNLTFLLTSYQGRIRRLHYWLAAIGVGIVFGVIFNVLGMTAGPMVPGTMPHFSPVTGLIGLVLVAADVYIGLALAVKRAHDRDKSGWFLLVGLIPIIGAIWLLIDLGFLDGTQGPNRFGESPKGIGGPAPAVS